MEEQVVDEKKKKQREYKERSRQKNREKLNEKKKQYRLENKESIKKYKEQYRLENKERISDRQKQYHLQNREKLKEKRKQYRLENRDKIKHNQLKRKYNITLDDYEKTLQDQNGSCAICFVKVEEQKNNVLVVDHNHLTGEVRGLLCSNCNSAIGLLKERQEVIQNALKYLYEKGSCVLKEVG